MTNQFSKNLRFLRKRGNHNQDEISLLFNKRANTIGNWENQKSEPSLAELMKLSEYFNVSTQDLLHSDIEKLTFHQNGEIPLNESGGQNEKYYALTQTVTPLVNEGSPDAFWLILRELRAMNEKVDLLSASLQSAVLKRNSDKSYH